MVKIQKTAWVLAVAVLVAPLQQANAGRVAPSAAATHTKAELIAKGGRVVSGDRLRQMLSGAVMTALKPRSGYSWSYGFGCNGAGLFSMGGDMVSQDKFTFLIQGDVIRIDNKNPTRSELKQIITLNNRHFVNGVHYRRDGKHVVFGEVKLRKMDQCR